MTSYIDQVRLETKVWEKTILKPAGFIERTSKHVQSKINHMLPDRVHDVLTSAVKGMVQAVLFGLDYIPKGRPQEDLPLEIREQKAKELIISYKRLAAAEGAGTGAGGIMLGLADFPALLAIKMKFLFELSTIYGHDTRDYRERLFLLYIFQLAFSSADKRPELYNIVAHWDQTVLQWPPGEKYLQNINWEQFQQEYRDAIDFRKTLQILPGIGAVVGAWVNYGLLEDLGKTAMNCFRLRILAEIDKGGN